MEINFIIIGHHRIFTIVVDQVGVEIFCILCIFDQLKTRIKLHIRVVIGWLIPHRSRDYRLCDVSNFAHLWIGIKIHLPIHKTRLYWVMIALCCIGKIPRFHSQQLIRPLWIILRSSWCCSRILDTHRADIKGCDRKELKDILIVTIIRSLYCRIVNTAHIQSKQTSNVCLLLCRLSYFGRIYLIYQIVFIQAECDPNTL